MASRPTPIEEFIEEGEVLAPKVRYVKKRQREGFVRRAYWVHVDDEQAVARFVKDLENKRRGEA